MAEQQPGLTPQASPKPVTGPVNSPEPWQAAHLTLAASFGEFTVGFGRSRMVFDQNNSVTQAVEWFASVSMSPQVAKQMFESLRLSLEEYEKKNGKIPVQTEVLKKL